MDSWWPEGDLFSITLLCQKCWGKRTIDILRHVCIHAFELLAPRVFFLALVTQCTCTTYKQKIAFRRVLSLEWLFYHILNILHSPQFNGSKKGWYVCARQMPLIASKKTIYALTIWIIDSLRAQKWVFGDSGRPNICFSWILGVGVGNKWRKKLLSPQGKR